MNGLSIRLLSGEEAGLAAEIARACFSEPWTKEGFLSAVDNSHAIVLAAFYEGEMTGFLCGTAVCEEGTVDLLGVLPSFRHKGIARELLERFLAECRRRSVSRLSLEVRESNWPARELYYKMGFLPVGKRTGFYKQPEEDALILAWEDFDT